MDSNGALTDVDDSSSRYEVSVIASRSKICLSVPTLFVRMVPDVKRSAVIRSPDDASQVSISRGGAKQIDGKSEHESPLASLIRGDGWTPAQS